MVYDGDSDHGSVEAYQDEQGENEEDLVIEELSPGAQQEYWAREKGWLREAWRRLGTEQGLEPSRDPNSVVSISFDGVACCCIPKEACMKGVKDPCEG